MYVFQADTYCDSCGIAICAELDADGLGPATPDDEYSFDSDEYPKAALEEATDYVDHCASGAECREAIDLLAYGLPTVAMKPLLEGAETQRVGAILSDGLTADGVSYTNELLSEADPTPYQEALHRLWRETFDGEL